MSAYATYPLTYRAEEVRAVQHAVQAGECVAIIGLSGSGKSNLMGFLEYHLSLPAQAGQVRAHLVDCNRLAQPSPEAFYTLLGEAMDAERADPDLGMGGAWKALDKAVNHNLQTTASLCLLLDRFDALEGAEFSPAARKSIYSGLRALRDAHKYALTFVTAARRPLDPLSELAELFYAHTRWLGPLAAADVHWSASQYAQRRGLAWDTAALNEILALSWGYPAFVRAICEAHAAGTALELPALQADPAVQRRVQEFLADHPTSEMLRLSGLDGHPLLAAPPASPVFDTSQLTAKEHLLWEYLRQHPEQVCEKDQLVQAVWPEDRIFERGIRDDSLAQLVRRLREKVEPEPSTPRHILTIPGRGYRYCP
ncbi:MAG: winged helix-turn-helix domain-containing protein [Anaerolineales bacterium]|nr:winged helix-turn-helix domain-containing protein [Anaerolineales bacterium]